MIAISPGHHSLSPGARSDNHSEHAEACIWAGLVAAQVPGAQVVTGTTAQKLATITVLRPSLAVELHFGSDKLSSSSGTTVLAAGGPVGAGCAAIEALRNDLVGLTPWLQVSSGQYRGLGALDFFLAGARGPALLVCVDDFRNLPWIQSRRYVLCAAIAASLARVDTT